MECFIIIFLKIWKKLEKTREEREVDLQEERNRRDREVYSFTLDVLYIAQYTLYIVQYTLYIVQYTLYIVQYTFYNVHFTLIIIYHSS